MDLADMGLCFPQLPNFLECSDRNYHSLQYFHYDQAGFNARLVDGDETRGRLCRSPMVLTQNTFRRLI